MENANWCLLENFGALEMEYVDCLFTNFLVLHRSGKGGLVSVGQYSTHFGENICTAYNTLPPHFHIIANFKKSDAIGSLETWKIMKAIAYQFCKFNIIQGGGAEGGSNPC